MEVYDLYNLRYEQARSCSAIIQSALLAFFDSLVHLPCFSTDAAVIRRCPSHHARRFLEYGQLRSAESIEPYVNSINGNTDRGLRERTSGKPI